MMDMICLKLLEDTWLKPKIMIILLKYVNDKNKILNDGADILQTSIKYFLEKYDL